MKFLGIALLIIVSIAATYFWQQDAAIPLTQWFNPNTTEKTDKQTTAYIEQLERYHFNKDGSLDSRIQAEQAYQYNQSPDWLFFDQPIFYATQNNNQWIGKAEHGKIQLSSQHTVLMDNVIFSRQDNSVTVHTALLNIDGNRKIAYNDLPIKLSSDSSQTTAAGINIDFNQQTIQLSGHVQTIYQAPHSMP